MQLRSLPIVSPKNVLAAAYSINIYASFRGAFPSFVYTKLQCNEENLSMTYQKERARHTGRAFSFRIYTRSLIYHSSIIGLSSLHHLSVPVVIPISKKKETRIVNPRCGISSNLSEITSSNCKRTPIYSPGLSGASSASEAPSPSCSRARPCCFPPLHWSPFHLRSY